MCYIIEIPRLGKHSVLPYTPPSTTTDSPILSSRIYSPFASSASSSTNTLEQESDASPPFPEVKRIPFPNRSTKRPPRYFCLFHGCFFSCPKKLELERHVNQAHAEAQMLAQAETQAQKKRKRANATESPEAEPVPKRFGMLRRQTAVC